jgi:hypothetical protein
MSRGTSTACFSCDVTRSLPVSRPKLAGQATQCCNQIYNNIVVQLIAVCTVCTVSAGVPSSPFLQAAGLCWRESCLYRLAECQHRLHRGVKLTQFEILLGQLDVLLRELLLHNGQPIATIHACPRVSAIAKAGSGSG